MNLSLGNADPSKCWSLHQWRPFDNKYTDIGNLPGPNLTTITQVLASKKWPWLKIVDTKILTVITYNNTDWSHTMVLVIIT